MRLSILAVGYARGTSEGALCDEFLDRAQKMGRNMGFPAVTIDELAVGKARDAAARMADEAAHIGASASAESRPERKVNSKHPAADLRAI